MTDDQIKNMGRKGYMFGNKQSVTLPYDKESKTVIIKDDLFCSILQQIPSNIPEDMITTLNGMILAEKDFE